MTGSAAIRLGWTFPLLLPVLLAAVAAPAAEPDAGLPRVRRLVAEHAPVRVVVHGDSISEVKKGWSGGASAPGAEQQLPAGGGSVAPSSRSTDRTPGPRPTQSAAEAVRERGIGDVCWVGDLDPGSPTLGLPGLADVQTVMLFEGTPEVGSYSHHGYLFVHQGTVYATWSNHRRDEDAPGQRVLGSRSADGGRTWQPCAEIFPPQDRIKSASEQDDERDRVLIANGFAVVGGDLYAVAEAHVLEERRGLGRLARKLSPEGAPGPIFWLTPTPPDPLPGFASYPSGADAEEAELAEQISRFIARPEHLPSWEFAHQTCSPRAADGHQLCEPTQGWRLPDGTWVRLLRDLAVPQTRRNYAQFSVDDGLTWTPARRTNFPDACSRSAAGVLPDGTVFVVNNPGSGRDPLVISLAGDGLRFDRHAVIRSGAPPVAQEGRWKGAGFQYPRAVVCGDALLVIYSIGKEDMAVSRIPLAALDSIPVSPGKEPQPPHLGD